ncbi:hypothetical protein AX15_005179 [Amanita polypyramis BW_CC]|nr:hypothetical protein AX15_005179 [Amanita polypyramis BW_CC]
MDATPNSNTEPLFLFDDDSDVEFVAAREHHKNPPEVDSDAIEQPQTIGTTITTTFDLEAYQRESLARHRSEASKTRKSVVISDPVPASATGARGAGAAEPSDDRKPRQKPTRLDEGTLLGSRGFPQLIKDTKDFRMKGKGHEATDLNRLLQIYQFWTHQLHPKTQFRDTIQRVEKLCHSRRMLSALSVWRDDARGKLDVSVQLSEEEQGGQADDGQERETIPMDGVARDSPPSCRAASHPPTSDMESESNLVADEFSDNEMDALIQEYANGPDVDMEQDPVALEEYFAASVPQLDLDRNVENAAAAQSDPASTTAPPPSAPEEEEDWGEDMYI